MTTAPTLAEVAARIARQGPQFDAAVAAATRALYAPLLDGRPAATEHRDLAYGPHERHRLDLYLPDAPPRAAVVFVHGGGFVAGDKDGDGRFYPNVGRWLARQGVAGVVPNYRLAPANPWPAGARDVAAVVDWLAAGQAPDVATSLPLIVIGQSAGASHVASWLFDAQARGGEARPGCAGVALLSGFYRVQAPLPAGPAAYFGDNPALYPQRSPLGHATDPGLPLLLCVAEFDPPWIARQTYALAEVVTAASTMAPAFHWFGGHNHVSTVQSLGTPQDDAALRLRAFIDQVAASAT